MFTPATHHPAFSNHPLYKEEIMIEPTVGRVVWFWPEGKRDEFEQPRAAMIAHVWNDKMVNLGFLSSNGEHHYATSVRLIQGDDTLAPAARYYCEWPTRAEQAKKHEGLDLTDRVRVLERAPAQEPPRKEG